MGFLSYGSAKALSYTHDFQKDIDRLYQREAYGAQIKAEREKKAMFYASLMKEGTAATQYNTQRLEGLYEGLQREIADYAVANPDLEQDPRKLAHLMSISDKFLNNNIIAEDQEVQKHWNMTKEALAKGDIYEDEYFEAAERYTNYSQNGGDPYVFSNPKRREFMDIWQESQVLMKPIVTVDEKGNQVITKSAVPEANFAMAANMTLSNKDNYRTVEQMFKRIPEEQRAAAGWQSPNDYYASLLRQGNQPSELERRYNELYLLNYKAGIDADKKAASEYVPSYFVSGVLNKMNSGQEIKGDVAVGALTELGAKKGTMISTPEIGRTFQVLNAKGEFIDVPIMGTIYNENASRAFTIGGVGYVEHTVTVSIDEGDDITKKSLQDNGFIAKTEKQQSLLNDPTASNTITRNQYTGSIVLPMILNDANIRNYDEAAGMSETARMQNESTGAYNVGQLLMNAYANNSPQVYNPIIRNSTSNELVNIRKLARSNDPLLDGYTAAEINSLANLDIESMSWKPDPEIPGSFIGTDKNESIKLSYYPYGETPLQVLTKY